jgi:hypothetical protein
MPGVNKRVIYSTQNPVWLWTHPPLYPFGYQEPFPWGIKQPGCQVDDSPLSQGQIVQRYTSALVLVAGCLIKHTDSFICTHTVANMIFPVDRLEYGTEDLGKEMHISAPSLLCYC